MAGTCVTAADCTADQYLQPFQVAVGSCQNAEVALTPAFYKNEWRGGPGWTTAGGELEQCDLGYYCPLNMTENPPVYNLKIQCVAGEWCPPGMVAPLSCPSLRKCGQTGNEMQPGAAGIAVLAILVIVLILIYLGARWRTHRRFLHANRARLAFSDGPPGEGADLGEVQPVLIEFDKLGLSLTNKKKTKIISDVSGIFHPASLVALMGPSGCGKTTFMNTISGRAQYGKVEGTIRVNGVDDGLQNAASIVGFVPQDDTVQPSLTVYDNIYYQAMTRLKADMTHEEKKRHVEAVIEVLGLGKVRDSIVGDELTRGISGGQKKRVNIGLELAAKTPVLFMDEPTSGLDGAATVTLAACLQKLVSIQKCTIVVVIHQPRQSVFECFNSVLLLGEGGKTIFCGRRDGVVPYLTGLGFPISPTDNPADWAIDCCHGFVKNEKDEKMACPTDLYTRWAETHAPNALDPEASQYTGAAAFDKSAVSQPLKRPKKVGLHTAVFHLTDRAFRSIDVKAFCVVLMFYALLGALVGSMVSESYEYYNVIHILDAGCDIFAMIICVNHRADYGDQKVTILRELNTGMPVLAIFIANTIRMVCTTFVEALAYASTKYLLLPPYQSFGVYNLAHWGLGIWWASFAAPISLWAGRTTSIMICLFAPNIVKMFDGSQGRSGLTYDGVMSTDEDVLSDTVREQGASYFFPNRWFWQLTYAKEIQDYPDYIVNLTQVNNTLYWRDIPEDLQYAQTQAVIHLFLWPVFAPPWFLWTLFLLYTMKASSRSECRAFFAPAVNLFERICCTTCTSCKPASAEQELSVAVAIEEEGSVSQEAAGPRVSPSGTRQGSA